MRPNGDVVQHGNTDTSRARLMTSMEVAELEVRAGRGDLIYLGYTDRKDLR